MKNICKDCTKRHQCSYIEQMVIPDAFGDCFMYEQDKIAKYAETYEKKETSLHEFWNRFADIKHEPYKLSFTLGSVRMPKIKNVIFNDPATIVFWEDGTKTIVKCQDGDIFDPEKGLTMAISKKALGNKGNYCNEIKKWLPEEPEEIREYPMPDLDSLEATAKRMKKAAERFWNSFKEDKS